MLDRKHFCRYSREAAKRLFQPREWEIELCAPHVAGFLVYSSLRMDVGSFSADASGKCGGPLLAVKARAEEHQFTRGHYFGSAGAVLFFASPEWSFSALGLD